jgi:hypothetical protein
MSSEHLTKVVPPNSSTREHPKGKGVDFAHPCAANIKILDHDRATVECVPRREKVAIVGFALSSTLAAPFDDPEYEIWAMNQLYRHIPRADRWFEIHHNWNEHVVDGTDHEGWMKSFPGPIYVAHRIPGIPNTVAFPREECAKLGHDYFTSSIAFMIALAIRDGFKVIELYGVDLVVGEEYSHQKPCAEFWMGLAAGRGITVGTHQNSALLKQSFCYGYESEPKSLVLLTEMQTRRQWLYGERNKRMMELSSIDGAIADCEMWLELATLRSNNAVVAYEPPKPATS